MAIKATIHRVALQIADIDRGVYASPTLTLARQPSETDERLMVRLLAYALNLPADEADGALVPAAGVADADEPDLWQRSLSGELRLWVEVGQPDERRLIRAAGRADRVVLYAYSAAALIWWAGVQAKLARLSNVAVWQLPAPETQALAALAARTMQLQINVQEGQVWIGNATDHVEVHPIALKTAAA